LLGLRFRVVKGGMRCVAKSLVGWDN
jgi:hypothetical protein